MELNILNFGAYKINKSTSSEIILNTIELAKEVDTLGYKRFWLGEHYEINVAWRNPEILISMIAGITDRIRVGSGGSLIKLHKPLYLAQTYNLVEFFFPERIDFGFAAGGADNLVGERLNFINQEIYEIRIEEFLGYFNNKLTNEIKISPYINSSPEFWILGSGYGSCSLAVKYKTALCLSLFHTKLGLKEMKIMFNSFITQYQKVNNESPKLGIAVAGNISKSEKISKKIIKESQEYISISPSILGDYSQCAELLYNISIEFEGAEVFFLDVSNRFQEKIEAFKELAKILNL